MITLILGLVLAQDQGKIDAAIAKGVEWLRDKGGPPHEGGAPDHSNELILYTLLTGDVPASDPRCKQILEAMLAEPLVKTYKVALQAMILEEVERVKHQPRIWQCAQFLVDNMSSKGNWHYGEPTAFGELPPAVPKPVASGGVKEFAPRGTKVKPAVTRKLPVKKNRDGPNTGDNSNTQYAALGLRACHDSGILFPKDLVSLAKKWWFDSAHAPDPKDGGYGGRGWCYGDGHNGHNPYGSMTAGGVGSLSILDYILGHDPKRDPLTKQGLEWLGGHFAVDGNPGPSPEEWMNKDPKVMHYYYLYGLERAGMLADVKLMGKKDWYAEGATLLLAQQKEGGSWTGGSNEVWDTCFAILFLKKATRPLVISEDINRRK